MNLKSIPRSALLSAAILMTRCEPSVKPEPPVSNISWSTINSIYNLKYKKTDLQKDERWKEFKGQKVQWTGTVASVAESFGTLTLQVKMNPSTFTSDLLIQLKDSERSRAMLFNKGDSITFTGILDSWGSILPITLKDGQIVR